MNFIISSTLAATRRSNRLARMGVGRTSVSSSSSPLDCTPKAGDVPTTDALSGRKRKNSNDSKQPRSVSDNGKPYSMATSGSRSNKRVRKNKSSEEPMSGITENKTKPTKKNEVAIQKKSTIPSREENSRRHQLKIRTTFGGGGTSKKQERGRQGNVTVSSGAAAAAMSTSVTPSPGILNVGNVDNYDDDDDDDDDDDSVRVFTERLGLSSSYDSYTSLHSSTLGYEVKGNDCSTATTGKNGVDFPSDAFDLDSSQSDREWFKPTFIGIENISGSASSDMHDDVDGTNHEANFGYWFTYAADYYQHLSDCENTGENHVGRQGDKEDVDGNGSDGEEGFFPINTNKNTKLARKRIASAACAKRKLNLEILGQKDARKDTEVWKKRTRSGSLTSSSKNTTAVDSIDKDDDSAAALHPDVTPKMRTILVDWLVEVADECKLQLMTLFRAVKVLDQVLLGVTKEGNFSASTTSFGEIPKKKLQCLGCACMLIATKLEDVSPLHVKDFVHLSADAYSRREIVAMELRVCTFLSFNLKCLSSLHYLERFVQAGCVVTTTKPSSTNMHHAKPSSSSSSNSSLSVTSRCSDETKTGFLISKGTKRRCRNLNNEVTHHDSKKAKIGKPGGTFTAVMARRKLNATRTISSSSFTNSRNESLVVVNTHRGHLAALLKMTTCYLLELSLLEYKFVLLPNKIIAAAAVYLATMTLGFTGTSKTHHRHYHHTATKRNDNKQADTNTTCGEEWNATMRHYTGYDVSELKDTVLQLRALHQEAETSDDLRNVFSKYSKKKCLRVAFRTVLQVEQLGFS